MRPFFPLSSERKFGLMFTVLFAWLGLRAAHHHRPGVLPLLLLAALFLLAALLLPRVLAPLTKAWFLLGNVMGKFVSPVVLGAIFFLCVTPVGLFQRLMGRDSLKMRPNSRKVASYWVDRTPPGPDASSFKNQF